MGIYRLHRVVKQKCYNEVEATDPMCESVYTGMLFDTPEELRTLEVLYTATSMSYNLPVVVVFLPKGYEIPRR